MPRSSNPVREFMESYLSRMNGLMAISADPRTFEPMQIIHVAGPETLKRVTTTGLTSHGKRRYYLTPDPTRAEGWKILQIEVECAVCHGKGMLGDDVECDFCHATGWLGCPSRTTTPSLLPQHSPRPSPRAEGP